MSVQDIKHGEIHYRYLLLIVDFSYPIAYLGIIMTFIFYKYIDQYIGGADILISLLLMSRYGLFYVSNLLLISSILALVYCLIFKVKKIKFIPFMFISFIIYQGGIL